MAFVWFNWVPLCDRVLEVHACAAPSAHGRWLTRRTMDSLYQIIDTTNCLTVIAQAPTPFLQRFWRRMGLTVRAGLAYQDIKELMTWASKLPSSGPSPSGGAS